MQQVVQNAQGQPEIKRTERHLFRSSAGRQEAKEHAVADPTEALPIPAKNVRRRFVSKNGWISPSLPENVQKAVRTTTLGALATVDLGKQRIRTHQPAQSH